MGYALVEVESEDDWRAYHAIRREVLWEARGLNGYNAQHGDEFLSGHHPLLLKWAGQPIATLRLDEFGDGSAAVRLVAVARRQQRLGHGTALMGLIEAEAARRGLHTLLVNAAPDAVGFYERFGWRPFTWDLAAEVGPKSDCTQMKKAI